MSARAQKLWSANALADGMRPIAFHCDGRPLAQCGAGIAGELSPMQHLLLAIAGCYAETCRTVLVRRDRAGVKFEVIATGQMSPRSKHRLSGISVIVLFQGGITAIDAAHIVEEATPLCVVANALGGSSPVVFGSRTAAPVQLSNTVVPRVNEVVAALGRRRLW